MISRQRSPSVNSMTDLQPTERRTFRISPRATATFGTLALLAVVLAMPLSTGSPVVVGTPLASAPMGPHLAAGTPSGPLLANLGLPTGVSRASELSLATYGAPLSAGQLRYTPSAAQIGGHSTAPAAHPSGSSTSTNYYVTGSDCATQGNVISRPWMSGAGIAQIGSSNQTLIAGEATANSLFNVTGYTFCSSGVLLNTSIATGLGVVDRSTDGGKTWSSVPIPRNVTLWNGPSAAENGSMTTGPEEVAAAPNNLGLAIVGYSPACVAAYLQFAGLNCSSPAGLQAPWGFGISRSTDGGVTWSNATQVSAVKAIGYENFASTCAAQGFSPGYYYNGVPERPWIVTNGTLAVAGWSVFTYTFDTAACTYTANAVVQVVHSTNGGQTWSATQNISNVVSEWVTLAWGAPNTGDVTSVFADFANATTGITYAIEKSTNGGASWSTEKDLTNNLVNPISGTAASPDVFAVPNYPQMASDNWTGSAHSGNLYVVWADNQTGTHQGQPAVAFMNSTNGGTTWSPVTYLTAPNAGESYLMPDVTVSPTGTVWVNYYGVQTGGGLAGGYQLFGTYSLDGGHTWAPQYQISDTLSQPGTSLMDLGWYMGAAGTSAGETPVWFDCRSANCGNADVDLYTANVNSVAFTTNGSGVNASVTIFGSTSTDHLPAWLGLDVGTSVTVQVPQVLPYNATTVSEFAGFVGITSSTSYQTTFTYTGAGNLEATYDQVPAAFIRGYFTPDVSGATLTINGQPIALAPYNATSYQYFITTAASGTAFTLVASAPKYTTATVQVPTSAGATTWQNFTLVRQTGHITGTVAPKTGVSITVNGSAVAVDTTNGTYSDAVPWGWYWVNATATGYTNLSVYRQVNPGAATVIPVNLVGGWVEGIVTPSVAGLVANVSGSSATTISGNTFNATVTGGYHTVIVTQPGYNLSTITNVFVKPGVTTFVNVSLTNRGWISGQVAPLAAVKGLLLEVTKGSTGGPVTYDQSTGTFNVSEVGGTGTQYTVTAKSSGYNTTAATVTVTAGNGTVVNFVMNQTSTNTSCTQTNTCVNITCQELGLCPNQVNNAIALGELIGIIILVVIILVVVLVVVLVVRRRRGGAGGNQQYMAPQDPQQPVYEASSPSDLPKLQSDGSMGPGNPPPSG